MLEKIPNDSVAAKHLTPDLRKILKGLSAGDSSTLVQNEVFSIMEIAICGVISTTNIALSGSQTIDGFSSDLYEMICVNGNTDQTQNGIYLPRAGAWERWEGATAGQLIRVLNGTVNGLTWWCNINTTLNVGTTNIEYAYLFTDTSITDGTVTNSTLRWSGTDWVENVKLLAAVGATENYISIISPDGLTNSGISAIVRNLYSYFAMYGNITNGSFFDIYSDTDVSRFLAKYRDNRLVQVRAYSTKSYMQIKNLVTDILINAYPTYSATNKIFENLVSSVYKNYILADGTIMSDVLTASTVLVANASKEIVSLANPATDKILAFESSALTWVDKPKNHYSFNPANATFQNLNSGATTLTVIPNFKVALSANKRYAIECTVYLATGTAFDIADNDFNLQLIGNTNWLTSNKFIVHHELIINRPLGNTYMPQFSGLETDIMCTVYNTTPGILYGSLTIRGHIDTGANADDLELFCRVVSTGYTDNTKNVVIAEGSYIKAVECSIN